MNAPNDTNGVITQNNDIDLKLQQDLLEGNGNGSGLDENGNEEDVTTRILRFLSTASNEALSGIAVVLFLSTYVILGRLGLVLLGAMGGVVLHATWEGSRTTIRSVDDVRREKGLDIIRRVLDLRENRSKIYEEDEDDAMDSLTGLNFDGFRPETGAALNELVDAIIRDYVKWWYNPILPNDQTFPIASKRTLTRFILSISQHLSRKRPADTFLDFLTNSSSIVIVFLNELASAMSASPGSNKPADEIIYNYLEANPNGSLANVLNEKQQVKKFKMIADDILQNFLEKPTYECDPARTFLKEILAEVVLEMTLKSCSKPEWINGWIIYLLEDGEPGLGQAIDEAMESRNMSAFSDMDGNIGNVALAKTPKSPADKKKEQGHMRRVSRAEDAMEEAMAEAKRLSMLIAAEDAKKFAEIGVNDIKDEETRDLAEPAKENIHPESNSSSPMYEEPETPTADSRISMSGSDTNGRFPMSPDSKHSRSPTTPQTTSSFTSFDQIVPPTALQSNSSPLQRRKTATLTLHNANIILYDDSTASDKGKIKSKPTMDYMVQIEPDNSLHQGWMIVRKYGDFETLHEVIRRIAQVSGATAFIEQHQTLPNWKDHTKPSLRGELERYIKDACIHQPLAESEGMKRFLEKDTGNNPIPSNKPGFGWPSPATFENMGKGMFDKLASAPKGAATGVTGVLSTIGSLGQKKPSQSSLHSQNRFSTSALPKMDTMNSAPGSVSGSRKGRTSEDSLRAQSVTSQPTKSSMERRPSHISLSHISIAETEGEHESASTRSSMSGRRSMTNSRTHSRDTSLTRSKGTPLSSPTTTHTEELKLPPPPTQMPDDYAGNDETYSYSYSRADTNTSIASQPILPPRPRAQTETQAPTRTQTQPQKKKQKEATPLTEDETRVALELLFAVITELYSLSSAWNIRLTLLNAAKTYLLRPGNPSLAAIQTLIQDSFLAPQCSDKGVAGGIKKIRENALPTEEEIGKYEKEVGRKWVEEMAEEEKEKLRVKARKLLVEKGMPLALTGVMGEKASRECLGRVFDCLQGGGVARGLVFGVLLQAVRAVTC